MNRVLLFLSAVVLLASGCQDYQIKLIGQPDTDDGARQMIQSADGDFLVAGYLHNKAAIYRLNCEGEIIHQALIEEGHHSAFNTLVELPDQQIVAAGSIHVEGKEKGLLVLLSATLEILNTRFTDAGSFTNIKDIALISPDILAIFGETSGAKGVSAVYMSKADAQTFEIAGAPVLLNNENRSDSVFLYECTPGANGNLFLCGGSCESSAKARSASRRRAWVSCINPNGAIRWTYAQQQNYPGAYGASYFSSLTVNTVTGNLLATGVRFSGDSREYQTDPYAALLSAEGELITEMELPLSGCQNIFDCKAYMASGVYLAVGDSSGVRSSNTPLARPMIIEIEEDSTGSLQMKHYSVKTDMYGSARSIACKANGLWFAAGELYPDNNLPADIAVALPQPDAHITMAPDTLWVRTAINNAHIAWYKDGELLKEGSQDWIFFSEGGTYEVFVSDPDGCSNNEALFIEGPDRTDAEAEENAPDAAWHALPNPVNDQLTLYNDLPQSGDLSLALFTPEGRQLWRRQLAWAKDATYTTINMSDCPKGAYYLRIYDKQKVEVIKIFKN